MNPLLNVTIAPLDNIKWGLSSDGTTMDVLPVYARWLRDPALMSPDVRHRLLAAGLTTTDFTQILKTNPFTSPNSAIDPDRFLPTSQSFPYIPPLSSGDPVATTTYTQQNSVTNTASHSTQVQYDVGVSLSGSIKVPIQASLKVTTSFQWTNTSTSGSTDGISESAALP